MIGLVFWAQIGKLTKKMANINFFIFVFFPSIVDGVRHRLAIISRKLSARTDFHALKWLLVPLREHEGSCPFLEARTCVVRERRVHAAGLKGISIRVLLRAPFAVLNPAN
jgi:hypothetical protein